MEYKLDISGEVDGKTWSDLSPFTQGYIEALFQAELPDGAQLRGKHIPLGFSDLAPETLARIIADCEAQAIVYTDRKPDQTDGRIFWSGRQNHVLTQRGFPPLTVQLGADGKVRFAA